ncbi:unnamed protein product [Closterium sp. Yama58-4]|nr:unnamed protein product [Closterium sp. Yama58-4]
MCKCPPSDRMLVLFAYALLVEKILREQPGVGQLYLLIQPTALSTASQRLKQQVRCLLRALRCFFLLPRSLPPPSPASLLLPSLPHMLSFPLPSRRVSPAPASACPSLHCVCFQPPLARHPAPPPAPHNTPSSPPLLPPSPPPHQVVPSPLFAHLRQRHGEGYEAFMASKLTAVPGNMGSDGLGLPAQDAAALAGSLHVIFNFAATTDFEAPYDVALNINTLGPRRLLAFAKQCTQLELLVHVSTGEAQLTIQGRQGFRCDVSYVNGQYKGRCMEQPFSPGDTMAAKLLTCSPRPSATAAAAAAAASKVPVLDLDGEVAQALRERAAVEAAAAARGASEEEVVAAVEAHMCALGRARASMFGWQDTYALSKSMGEMALAEQHNGAEGEAPVPVVVVRPSIVESALYEPMPGWIEGFRMTDPVLMAYGKGAIPGFLAKPDGVCDMHFAANPMKRKDGTPIVVSPAILFPWVRLYRVAIWFQYRLPRLLMKIDPRNGPAQQQRAAMLTRRHNHCERLARVYAPYCLGKARFDSSNTEDLFSAMSLEEQQIFKCNVSDINWNDYICLVHIPGLRKFVVKEKAS